MLNEMIKQLLEAGVHFGHQTKRWNPKMERYIFGERNHIYIIDLEKTAKCIEEARTFLMDLSSKGDTILFVGTKRQAQSIIKEEATRCNMPYVNKRWLGGLLTNFVTIRKSVQRLKEIEKMKEDGIFDNLTKKEVASLTKEMGKLRNNLSGVIDMDQLPKAMFIVDTKKEETALREANKLGILTVALIDTNSDPDLITYPIPGNDDAIKSIKLITSLVADCIIDGRKQFLSYLAKETPEYKEQEQEEVSTEDKSKKLEEQTIQDFSEKFEEEAEKELKPKPTGKKTSRQPRKKE